MKSYLVHLIRHGVSEGNLAGRYIGRTDSPLAIEGMKQLAQLKSQYLYPQADRYFCSPCTRCMDSLRILYPEAEFETADGFAECSFGDWENRPFEELKKDAAFMEWMKNGSQTAPPNGESTSEFMQRICTAFQQFVNDRLRAGETETVLVTHGGVIMTILSAFGLPRARFYDWMCDSGCGYTLRITPSLWMRQPVAEVINTLPVTYDEGIGIVSNPLIDAARNAADAAFGDLPDPRGEEDI